MRATSEPSPSQTCPATGAGSDDHVATSTLYAMLARVLEQTTALFEAQASTNHMLDELRRSIPAPEESADIYARLCRVEGLVATLAQANTGPPVDPHLSVQRQIDQRTRRGTLSPDGTPEHISETPRSNPPPSCPTTSAQETVVRDASGERTHSHEQVDGKAPVTIPPPDQLTPDFVVQDHHALPYAPSDTDLQSQKLLAEVERQPPIPSSRGIDDSRTTQDPSSTCAIGPLQVTQTAKEHKQVHFAKVHSHGGLHEDRNNLASLKDGLSRIAPRPDTGSNDESSLTEENFPWVVVPERDEAARVQLANLTSVLQQMLALCAKHKVMPEQQWSERLRWMEECKLRSRESVRMAPWLVEERVAAKQSGAHQGQPNDVDSKIEKIADEIQDWRAEHRVLLQALSDSWRADSSRQHEETINVVRATANEQVPYNIQGYLDEFSKALSVDVRMLLDEVGRLREERRRIQHEIGYLMMMQSTLVDGGEFGPPAYASPEGWPSPAGIPLPESPPPRPGWRVVPMRRIRRAPRPEAPPPPPESQAFSWATWQPNPQLAPTPPSVGPTLLVPEPQSPGLFGPRSPRDSPHRTLPREMEEPRTAIPRVPSWVTWPDPILFARDRTATDNPGLFGPRSPRDSPRTAPGEVEGPRAANPRVPSWVTWSHSRRASTSSSVVEPDLFVPDRTAADSPGLFGPRSPRGSWTDLVALPTGEMPAEAPRSPEWDSWGVPGPSSLGGRTGGTW